MGRGAGTEGKICILNFKPFAVSGTNDLVNTFYCESKKPQTRNFASLLHGKQRQL
jgi:hypothetical protein